MAGLAVWAASDRRTSRHAARASALVGGRFTPNQKGGVISAGRLKRELEKGRGSELVAGLGVPAEPGDGRHPLRLVRGPHRNRANRQLIYHPSPAGRSDGGRFLPAPPAANPHQPLSNHIHHPNAAIGKGGFYLPPRIASTRADRPAAHALPAVVRSVHHFTTHLLANRVQAAATTADDSPPRQTHFHGQTPARCNGGHNPNNQPHPLIAPFPTL